MFVCCRSRLKTGRLRNPAFYSAKKAFEANAEQIVWREPEPERFQTTGADKKTAPQFIFTLFAMPVCLLKFASSKRFKFLFSGLN